jgi:hypothetical protein
MRDALLPQQLLRHFFLRISIGFLALFPDEGVLGFTAL